MRLAQSQFQHSNEYFELELLKSWRLGIVCIKNLRFCYTLLDSVAVRPPSGPWVL